MTRTFEYKLFADYHHSTFRRRPLFSFHLFTTPGVRLRFLSMFRRYALVPAIALFIAHIASGQTVTRAYAGNDGKAHVAFANGMDKTIDPSRSRLGALTFRSPMTAGLCWLKTVVPPIRFRHPPSCTRTATST